MHAAHSFLIDTTDKDDAISQLERYAERYCDENNWYEPMALITGKGEVHNMAGKNDWRGRDEFVKRNKLLKMCENARFDWAKKFALECVASDMMMDVARSEFGNKESALIHDDFDDQGYGDIIATIFQDVPAVVAKMYENFEDVGTQFESECWRRYKLAMALEKFLFSDIRPFSYNISTPYDYRCYDLGSRDKDGSELSILIVDIHT